MLEGTAHKRFARIDDQRMGNVCRERLQRLPEGGLRGGGGSLTHSSMAVAKNEKWRNFLA